MLRPFQSAATQSGIVQQAHNWIRVRPYKPIVII